MTDARFRRTRLGFEVLGLYVKVRWLVLRHGTASTVPILRRGLGERPSDDGGKAQVRLAIRLGRSVQKVLRLIPFDSRCLMRSLVLTGLLARRGVYATLVIGVRPEPNFAAHAWVEVDGLPMLPTDESTYRPLVEL
jgi:hypothetical protein